MRETLIYPWQLPHSGDDVKCDWCLDGWDPEPDGRACPECGVAVVVPSRASNPTPTQGEEG